jgi:hypothetical protein
MEEFQTGEAAVGKNSKMENQLWEEFHAEESVVGKGFQADEPIVGKFSSWGASC